MKIAMVVNSYPPRLGGLESHISSLAQELAVLGHEVWVLTIGTPLGSRLDDGVRVLTGAAHLPVADVITVPSVGTRAALTRFLQSRTIDVVATHTRFFPMSFIGLRSAHAAGIPVIHTEHGSGFVASASPIISVGSRVVDLTLGHYVLANAERVLAVSPSAARFAARLGANNPAVFYNAITPSTRVGSPSDRPHHLVFVGRVVRGKGWEAFLEAVAQLRKQGLPVIGDVLGDGADLARARELCERLGLGGVVRIRGRVPQEEVRQALAGSTLVNPTILSEGFQTTLLEAIAEHGRVVTYEVPGAQILRHGGAPIIICPERSVRALTESIRSGLESPLPLAPEDLVTEWTWPARAREYERIMQDVVAAGGAGRGTTGS